MKMIPFNVTKKYFYVFLLSMLSQVLSAQPPSDPSAAPDVPITGIEVLLGIGGAYGVKRFLRRKKSIE